jgi:hypothetical protein
MGEPFTEGFRVEIQQATAFFMHPVIWSLNYHNYFSYSLICDYYILYLDLAWREW